MSRKSDVLFTSEQVKLPVTCQSRPCSAPLFPDHKSQQTAPLQAFRHYTSCSVQDRLYPRLCWRYKAELQSQIGNAHYLYNLSSKLGCPMLQVMSINCKHAVVAAEPAILSSQAPFQKVQNKNSRLVRSAHKFNAELLAGVALVQRHLEAVLPGGAGGVRVAVGPAAEPPLSQHGEVQHRARLGKHGSSVVVRHIADVKAIDLQNSSKIGMVFSSL